jgi:hypothetical protein
VDELVSGAGCAPWATLVLVEGARKFAHGAGFTRVIEGSGFVCAGRTVLSAHYALVGVLAGGADVARDAGVCGAILRKNISCKRIGRYATVVDNINKNQFRIHIGIEYIPERRGVLFECTTINVKKGLFLDENGSSAYLYLLRRVRSVSIESVHIAMFKP